MAVARFDAPTLETLCSALGDTGTGLKGPKSARFCGSVRSTIPRRQSRSAIDYTKRSRHMVSVVHRRLEGAVRVLRGGAR